MVHLMEDGPYGTLMSERGLMTVGMNAFHSNTAPYRNRHFTPDQTKVPIVFRLAFIVFVQPNLSYYSCHHYIAQLLINYQSRDCD